MPGPLFHVGAVAICPHGGQVTTVPGSPRVTVMGMPVATMADQFLVAGCVFTVGPKPQPCVKVQWLAPAARVKVMGAPVILAPGPGLCQSVEQIPQGPPSIITVQPRVTGM
jgi:uncharacterized Zn-binding protein involved in type VI secretion